MIRVPADHPGQVVAEWVGGPGDPAATVPVADGVVAAPCVGAVAAADGLDRTGVVSGDVRVVDERQARDGMVGIQPVGRRALNLQPHRPASRRTERRYC